MTGNRELTPDEREAIRLAKNEYARRRRERLATDNQRYLDKFYLRKAKEYGIIADEQA